MDPAPLLPPPPPPIPLWTKVMGQLADYKFVILASVAALVLFGLTYRLAARSARKPRGRRKTKLGSRWSNKKSVPVLLGLCALAGVILVLQTQAATVPTPCGQGATYALRSVKGLGDKVCRDKKGLYKIILKDGKVVETHGGDPAPATPQKRKSAWEKFWEQFTPTVVAGQGETPYLQGSPKAPACASSTDYYIHVLLMERRDGDSSDGYWQNVDKVKADVNEINGWLNYEGARYGKNINLKVYCEGGSIKIGYLPVSNDQDYGSIIAAAKSNGYSNAKAKYWIWDYNTASYGGLAAGCGDTSPSVNNCNNSGPHYAITWFGVYGNRSRAFLHEGLHTLGVMAQGAPHWDPSSPGHGRSGGADVMGAGLDCNSSRTAIDCGGDDYFNPGGVSASNYLYNHFNIGASYFRYFTGLGGSTTTSSGGTTSGGTTSGGTTSSGSWIWCASEGNWCGFSGTHNVIYGDAGSGRFAQTKVFTNGVSCTNQVFGDPAPGVHKGCWYWSQTTTTTTSSGSTGSGSTSTSAAQSGTKWVWCANETQQCRFTGSRWVAYGDAASGRFAPYKVFTNGVTCTNANFGDPAVGVGKRCWVWQ